MVTITRNIYAALAQRLLEQIADTNYFNSSVELDTEEIYTTLHVTLIIYRRQYDEPTCELEKIVDIVPVWWEFTTVDLRGEQPNDFSWSEFRKYLM